MENYDVIIIGGGASGLACAVRLTEKSGLRVLIVDSGKRVGKKLAATGNGQGNISNSNISADNYRSGNKALLGKIIGADCTCGLEVFKDTLFTEDDRGRIYPASRQASSLVDMLLSALSGRCDIVLGEKVTFVERGFKVKTATGKTFCSDCVVLAAGGKAQKQFGTDGTSYALAEAFGHTVTRLSPSLVQLRTDTSDIKGLKGIRADCSVKAIAEGEEPKEYRGDVIFTDYGVSGNAVFSVSPVFSRKTGILEIDFLPDFGEEEIMSVLQRRLYVKSDFDTLLCGLVHNQIGRAVIKRAGNDVKSVVGVLKKFTLPVQGTLGFDYAQVTHGGIDMNGVKDNLESKFCPNLYFAGEILDVDGDCGGYNLHWAFASGVYVADDILKKTDNGTT